MRRKDRALWEATFDTALHNILGSDGMADPFGGAALVHQAVQKAADIADLAVKRVNKR